MKSAATPLAGPPSAAVAQRPDSPAPPARRQRATLFAGPAAGALLLALWVIVYPRTPDLAGQVYRVGLFSHSGFVVWDEHWYAGHHIPAYSLLFPPLGSLLGLRLLGVLAVLASCLMFEQLTRSAYGGAARWGAVLFALAAVGDVWAGRVAFALGVSVALAAALALQRRHPVLAGALSALCAATSPVAALGLALAAVALSLDRRSIRPAATLAAPAGVVLLSLALLFPEGGYEPYPVLSFAATAAVVVLFLLALPRSARLLRIGAVLYLAACLGCLLIHSPVGSNIERFGVLLAGPLLLCALLSERRSGPGTPAIGVTGAIALCAATLWMLWGPVRESVAVSGSPATSAAYYAPLERFIASRPGPVRVEVPLTRSHWEAALLAPTVSLARGWDKQLDTRYDRALMNHRLSPAAYEGWLHEQAVGLVALPDVPLDPSSAREGALIRSGLPFLAPVYSSAHWRVFRVLGGQALAAGPGVLTALAHDSFSLLSYRAGSFLVRVHFSRYLTLDGGGGCVARAPGGWTRVTVDGAGRHVVAARFSLGRALNLDGGCSPGRTR